MKKKNSSDAARQGRMQPRRKKAIADPRLADVVVDTRKCLSMLRRVVRPPALPEIPAVYSGPFLN